VPLKIKDANKKSISPKYRAHLVEIVRFLPDATFAIDLKGEVIAWNGAMEELTGVRAEEVIGKGNYEYALPFYGKREPIMIDLVFKRDKKIEKRYRLFHREKDVLVCEIEVAGLNGQGATLWAKAKGIRNSIGKVVGAIESVRNITEFKKNEESLRRAQSLLTNQKVALEQKNIDLKDILAQVEAEKKRVQGQVLSNVETVLLPLMDKLKLRDGSEKYVSILKEGLNDLVSPFGRKISDKKYRLTSREIEVCNMIKNGLTGKEISDLLGLSFQTVEMHRKNIRRKLGISNKNVNMETFLKDL